MDSKYHRIRDRVTLMKTATTVNKINNVATYICTRANVAINIIRSVMYEDNNLSPSVNSS